MALTISPGAATLMLNSGINAAFDGVTNTIEIRDGTRPATADLTPTGQVLAEFPLVADSFAVASLGTMVGATPWTETSAPVAGTNTATWFRLRQPGDAETTNNTDVRIDGDVGTSGSDLNLSTTSITQTDQVTITQFDLSA